MSQNIIGFQLKWLNYSKIFILELSIFYKYTEFIKNINLSL